MICSAEDVAPLSICFELLTPDEAKELLDRTTFENRRVRKSSELRYAKMMHDGDWMDFTSMIVIDSSGSVIDGQHRLLAQIDSGETIGYVVMRGVPTSAYQVIDSGIRRRTSDRSFMSPRQASIAGACVQYEVGAPIRACLASVASGSTVYATEADVISWGEAHREYLARVERLYNVVRANIGFLSMTAFACFVCVGTERYGEDETLAFAKELARWDTECKQAAAAQKALQVRINGKPKDRLSQLAIMVNALTQRHNGTVPKMPTKATYTDKILDSWRKKVVTADAQD